MSHFILTEDKKFHIFDYDPLDNNLKIYTNLKYHKISKSNEIKLFENDYFTDISINQVYGMG